MWSRLGAEAGEEKRGTKTSQGHPGFSRATSQQEDRSRHPATLRSFLRKKRGFRDCPRSARYCRGGWGRACCRGKHTVSFERQKLGLHEFNAQGLADTTANVLLVAWAFATAWTAPPVKLLSEKPVSEKVGLSCVSCALQPEESQKITQHRDESSCRFCMAVFLQ